jgi:hypothetical protein
MSGMGQGSDGENTVKPPVAFISYSHDSAPHKQWVSELASKLMANGIEVIFDQWDLGLGDDVPKFMERGVGRADRVLMICTETYVHKANDGKGGAGYEAMIVTGELVKDLGTSKFIPVVRQSSAGNAVPICVSTRLYINLSEGQDLEAQFQRLLRELHQVPAHKKPKLGPNPFGDEKMSVERSSPAVEGPPSEGALRSYQRASSAIRANDYSAWRQALKEARQESATALKKWRTKYDKVRPAKEGLPAMTDEAFGAVAPLIAIALAGVESGKEQFRRQIGIIDELLNPADWERTGLSTVVNVPDALVFLYQGLHGALAMETGQLRLALELARSPFQRNYSNKREKLMEVSDWTGWPDSISESCTAAWEFISTLPDRHSWLVEVFGAKEDYTAALSGYYALLNIAEASAAIASGQAKDFGKEMHLDVPLCAFQLRHEISVRAYRLLTADPNQLKEVWEREGVSTELMAQHWPKWIETCGVWLFGVYKWMRGMGAGPFHKDIFNEPALKVPEGSK